MSTRIKFHSRTLARASKAVKNAESVTELRAAQSVILSAQHGLNLQQIADVLGVSRATVGRIQQRERIPQAKRKQLPKPLNGWGGRRRSHLTWDQEIAFLAPWTEQAKTAGLIVISPIRAALAQHLGKPVKPSVVWRMLARHGWRKVAPDSQHPKGDPLAQEAWKKNSRRWWPPSFETKTPSTNQSD
jgi:transposase